VLKNNLRFCDDYYQPFSYLMITISISMPLHRCGYAAMPLNPFSSSLM
jgi:hypothetical protein